MEREEEREARRVLKWANKGYAPPFEMEIQITNKCNLNCLPCIARSKRKYKPEEEISKEKFVEIAEQAGKIGVKKCHIVGGGEVTCKLDKTVPTMKTAKKHGIYGSMVTNGTKFTDESIRKIVKMGWDSVFFSVNGASAETDDFLRDVEGTFEKALENIKRFNYWKKRLNTSKPMLNMSPVLTSQNFDEIKEMVQLASDLDLNQLFLQPLTVPDNDLGRKLRLNQDQVESSSQKLEKAIELADKLDLSHNLRDIDDKIVGESSCMDSVIESEGEETKDFPASLYCFLPWIYIGVRADGGISPCPVDMIIDNVKEKSIEEVWTGEDYKKIRKEIRNHNLRGDCKSCCPVTVFSNRDIRENIKRMMD